MKKTIALLAIGTTIGAAAGSAGTLIATVRFLGDDLVSILSGKLIRGIGIGQYRLERKVFGEEGARKMARSNHRYPYERFANSSTYGR